MQHDQHQKGRRCESCSGDEEDTAYLGTDAMTTALLVQHCDRVDLRAFGIFWHFVVSWRHFAFDWTVLPPWQRNNDGTTPTSTAAAAAAAMALHTPDSIQTRTLPPQ